ncbi:MAG TPA: hypothetical protein VNQ73_13920 [Ilumatobacter sp.]|nr:hypothetical protein [Ilumatobacter sp.]
MTSSEVPALQPIERFPGPGGLLLRGITRRCPWCGDRRAYFVGWFRRQSACRTCGHGFRRGDHAFELGAVTANMIVTFVLILVTLGVTIGVTAPDVPVVPVMVITAAIGLIGPALLYPVGYTLWQAIDLTMRPPTAAELAGEGEATL